MKKKYGFALSVMVFVLCIFGCSCSHEYDYNRNMIKNALEIDDLPEFMLVDSITETHSDGTVEEFIIVSFDDDEADNFEKNTAANWNYSPVSSKYMNFTDYASVLPDTDIDKARLTLTKLNENSDHRYIFIDKTAEFKKKFAFNIKEDRKSIGKNTAVDESSQEESYQNGVYYTDGTDPRTPLYAVGFSCGFYSPDEKLLYVYSIEPAYNIKYLKYLNQ